MYKSILLEMYSVWFYNNFFGEFLILFEEIFYFKYILGSLFLYNFVLCTYFCFFNIKYFELYLEMSKFNDNKK